MKNCKTCGVPQEKRPGCLKGCVIVDFSETMKEPFLKWHFTDYKQKESEKTCGNCGWHGKHWVENKTSMAECNENGFITSDDEKAGIFTNCQWKQIVCETCEGTGEVKNNSGTYSCPTCQNPKKERMMMPVRWEKSKANEENSVLITNAGVIGSVTVTMDGLAFRATAVDKIIKDTSLSNHGGTKRFDDEKQAKKAVEKALGVEMG